MIGKSLRIVGRVLIIILILSSSVLKLQDPLDYRDSAIDTYGKFYNFASGIGLSFLPSQQTFAPKAIVLIQIYALFQALTALLILIGDKFGGLLMLFVVFRMNSCCMAKALTSGFFENWTADNFVRLARFVGLLGIAFFLMSQGCCQKKQGEQCPVTKNKQNYSK